MKNRIISVVSFLAISGVILTPICMAISVATLAVLMASDVITAAMAAAIAIQHLAILAVAGGVSLLVSFCIELAKI